MHAPARFQFLNGLILPNKWRQNGTEGRQGFELFGAVRGAARSLFPRRLWRLAAGAVTQRYPRFTKLAARALGAWQQASLLYTAPANFHRMH
jgi:hypothetical protein